MIRRVGLLATSGVTLLSALVGLLLHSSGVDAQFKKAAPAALKVLDEYRIDQKEHVQSLAFSPDGKTLAVGGNNIALFDVSEGQPRETTVLATKIFFGVKGVAFSPDGNVIAAAGGDKTVRLWDLSKQPYEQRQSLTEHAAAVTGVAFSPDGQLLASCSDDNNAILWNVRGAEAVERAVLKTDDTFGVRAVAFNPKGKLLATTSGNGQVRLWDVTRPRPKQTGSLKTPGGIFEMRLAYAPDSRTVAVASHKIAYVLGTGTAAALKGHQGNVKDLAYSPDGRTLATAGEDGRLIFWNLSTLKRRFTYEKPGKFTHVAFAPLPPGTKPGSDMLLAVASDPREILVLRVGYARP
jgi:WD40 repeat protein